MSSQTPLMGIPETPVRRQPFRFHSSPATPLSSPPDNRHQSPYTPDYSITFLPHHTKLGLTKRTKRRSAHIIIAIVLLSIFVYFFRYNWRIAEIARQTLQSPREPLVDDALSRQKTSTPDLQKSDGIRPRAALISLVRNSELNDLVISIGDLERTFNNKTGHHYTWMFFSEEKFTETFQEKVSEVVSGDAKFLLIEEKHWGIPDWVDRERFADSLEYLGAIGVGKGWMVSYRHMCRWNSGFFFEHDALKDYDYYWRVEPDVRFFCNIDYNPFSFMTKNGLKYGFNMNILDDARSFPSLWRQTRKFLEDNPGLVHKEADLRWILDLSSGSGPRREGAGIASGKFTASPAGQLNAEEKSEWRFGEYNGCQFFSNFEIGDLNFFRSYAYRSYFRHLDANGGFFYERWGDAPVHTLAVALFLPKKDVHFFRDIGYQHGINMQCPTPANRHSKFPKLAKEEDQDIVDHLPKGRECKCEETALDENYSMLVPMESMQKKPVRSCLRMWLEVGDDVLPVETWKPVQD